MWIKGAIVNNLLAAVAFAIEVTAPSIVMLLLGVFLKRTGQVDGRFCAQASKLVFNYGLPLLLFVNLMEHEIHYGEQSKVLAAGAITVMILYLGAEWYAWKFIAQVRDKGVFVQGVFRSNLAIMGLALIMSAYGNEGVAAGAVYTGVITILFNILAVITLSRSGSGSGWRKMVMVLKKIATNPLIIGIVLALVLQQCGVKLPETVLQTARSISNMSLPLALICAGATFDMRSVLQKSDISLKASLGRLLIAPLLSVVVGLAFGLNHLGMGIIFLMNATPVASSSYVMAKAMGGNDVAAANIMGITTFGAMFSAAVGVVVLRSLNLM